MRKERVKNIVIVGLVAIMIVAAVVAYEPPMVTDNTEHGLIIVDAGEWGEVLPYTPDAPTAPPPTPTGTPEPSATSGPAPPPTATVDICQSAAVDWVMVIVEKAPLREIAGYNQKGIPIFGIYGKSDVNERIVAKRNKLLCAWKVPLKGDAGVLAYKLVSSQIVDGKYLPGDQYLYVLSRHVKNGLWWKAVE